MFAFYRSRNVEFSRLAPSDINLHQCILHKSHMLCDATRQRHVDISFPHVSHDRLIMHGKDIETLSLVHGDTLREAIFPLNIMRFHVVTHYDSRLHNSDRDL